MPRHLVKCYYCNIAFDASTEPYAKVNEKRYAHLECHNKALEGKIQEDKAKKVLESYIKKLFGMRELSKKIQKQLKKYEEKGYTYGGIYGALRYHFEVKGGSIDKAKEGVGIVEYIYEESMQYWSNLRKVKQGNREAAKKILKTPARKVSINSPQREPIQQWKNLFSFLNESKEEKKE